MGLNIGFSRDSYNDKKRCSCAENIKGKFFNKKLPNPKPDNYKIVRSKQIEKNLVIEIQYPDCVNYEGRKILLYENITLEQLLAQKLIDPHFSTNSKYCSPVARFEPTYRGWNMAIFLAVNGLVGLR